MITLEALNAKHGDAFLLRFNMGGTDRLWIIDGGPRGTWNSFLRKRLEQLRGGSETLAVDLAMLSHVDDDHVAGVLEMTKGLAEKKANAATFLEIKRFWHNSFVDLVGSEVSAKAGLAALASGQGSATAALAGNASKIRIEGSSLERRAFAVMASIDQGRELRDYLTTLELDGNVPFGRTMTSRSGKKLVDEAQVTIVGPIQSRLEAFRRKWEEASGKPAALASLFREDLDESPTNLSSLCMLVQIRRKKILFTGDARGDDVVDGFKDAKLGEKLPMHLDILKVPHHGSNRNITEKFLRSFPADHYVISADGKHGNPDKDVVRAIVHVRGDDRYTMHFTNAVPGIPELVKQLARGRNFDSKFRPARELSISVSV